MIDAELRHREGWVEAIALDEKSIDDKPEKVLRVPDAAVPEVLEGLGHHTRRRRREGRELCVWLGLTTEGKQRYAEVLASAPQLLEALRPGPSPPEEPDHNHPRLWKRLLEEGAGGFDL